MADTKGVGIYINGTQYATMEEATDTTSGLMTPSDKTKLTELESKYVDATLLASSWTSNGSVSTQTIEVEGLGADQNGFLGLRPGVTQDQYNSAANACISIESQSEGSITVNSYGTLPDIDIPVVIILLG